MNTPFVHGFILGAILALAAPATVRDFWRNWQAAALEAKRRWPTA